MAEFRDTASDFYKDLAKGKADQKDFEKHIYGQFGGKAYHKDNQDRVEDKAANEKARIQADFQNYIEKEKAMAAQRQ